MIPQLSSLTSEELTQVMSYLTAGSILKLCMCGNKLFNSLLTTGGGVQMLAFRILAKKRNSWPLFTSNFPRLADFEYHLIENDPSHQETTIIGLTMKCLPSTLRKLTLSFSSLPHLLASSQIETSTEAYHLHTIPYHDLGALFPQLVSLTLKTGQLSFFLFDVLPPQLTHLSLDSVGMLSHRVISKLPRSLTSLKLMTEYANIRDWTNRLHNLSNLIQHPLFAKSDDNPTSSIQSVQFPPGLIAFVSNMAWANQIVRFLPLSVTNIHLGFYNTYTKSDLEHMPPFLAQLVILGDWKRDEIDFSSLPPSVTTLFIPSLTHVDLDEAVIRTLPPSLTKGTFTRLSNLPDSVFALLPRRLAEIVDVKFASRSIACILDLPPHLKVLNAGQSIISSEQALALPRTLQSLCASKVASEGIAHLPPTLTSLTLLMTSLIPSEARDLPMSLTCLKWAIAGGDMVGFNGDELDHLANLKEMELVRLNEEQEVSNDASLLLVRLIPKTCTKISFVCIGLRFCDILRGLANHPHLKSIYCSDLKTPYTSDMFKALPRHINQIGFTTHFSEPARSTWRGLLSAIGVATSPSFNESDLRFLPDQITIVYVNARTLDRNLCLQYLPSSVTSFGSPAVYIYK
jgi:hypothetical protein